MTSRDFCYWLQGFFELNDPYTIDEDQTIQIKSHLALVFKHEIDPSMGNDEHQADLNEIHDKVKSPKKLNPPNNPGETIIYRC
jgi:hypothetical protein